MPLEADLPPELPEVWAWLLPPPAVEVDDVLVDTLPGLTQNGHVIPNFTAL